MLDTSVVLAGGTLEFLLQIAASEGARLVWTKAIADEVERKLPVRPEPVQCKVRQALATVADPVILAIDADNATAAGNCDAEDEHVLAAAIAARRLDPDADVVLLTSNLKDFDVNWAAEQGIRVLSPDELGVEILEKRPRVILSFVTVEPKERFERFLARMEQAGSSKTAAGIRALCQDLATED